MAENTSLRNEACIYWIHVRSYGWSLTRVEYPITRANVSDHSESLFVSAISAFEIALRHERKKLLLPLAPSAWWRESLSFHGITEIPVSGEIGTKSAMLPPLHNDPCDRIIIATAQIHRLVILTPDSHINRYPRIEVEW